jgi:serine/threonine protein phosphatase PrpC
LHIRYGSQSDQGKVRNSNEDSYAANLKNKLFLVADGMGGHAAGEIASQIAAATVEEVVASASRSAMPADQVLITAAQEANSRIYQIQRMKPEFAGMGSTLTALTIMDEKYFVAHVGDSRAYLLRDGVLEQVTRDHSLVWHLYETGMLRKEELSSHPQKNLITRSIGPHPQVEIDMEQGEAHVGDVFLLCSDGLTDVVTDERLRKFLADAKKSPQEIGETLVVEANERGGPDNITVVVVRLEPGAAEEEDTGKYRAL